MYYENKVSPSGFEICAKLEARYLHAKSLLVISSDAYHCRRCFCHVGQKESHSQIPQEKLNLLIFASVANM